jgi:hypothetical protein
MRFYCCFNTLKMRVLNLVSLQQFFPGRATDPVFHVFRMLPSTPTMERTRPADRSQLIRFSAVVFLLLALTSFLLAMVAA